VTIRVIEMNDTSYNDVKGIAKPKGMKEDYKVIVTDSSPNRLV